MLKPRDVKALPLSPRDRSDGVLAPPGGGADGAVAPPERAPADHHEDGEPLHQDLGPGGPDVHLLRRGAGPGGPEWWILQVNTVLKGDSPFYDVITSAWPMYWSSIIFFTCIGRAVQLIEF